MIELEHRFPEPDQLRQHRRQHPRGDWGDPAFEPVRSALRHQLNEEQEGYCVYCEAELDKDHGHIEHIAPRRLMPDLTFVYENLAHSCNGPGHCGHHKQGQTLPIEPRPGCNRFFALMTLDGQLAPAADLSAEETQQAAETLVILGLNVPALAWQRKGFADALRALSDPADVEALLSTIPFRGSLHGL
jgi:uncharacterized protein (TIGR02646 family)